MAEDTKGTATDPAAEGATPAAEANTVPDQETFTKSEVNDLLSSVRATRDEKNQALKEVKELRAQLKQLEGVDPELHAKLLAESAKREELDRETASRVQEIEKSYAEQLAAAKAAEEQATNAVSQLQLKWAFEKEFAAAGGRGGRFTELAFNELKTQVKLEADGSLAVVDKSGAYVLDDGKRVAPAEWLKKFKSDELLGYAFQAERGAGSGLSPAPGSALANGTDMHSLSSTELLMQAFNRKK